MDTMTVSKTESFLLLGFLQLQEMGLLMSAKFNWNLQKHITSKSVFGFINAFTCEGIISSFNSSAQLKLLHSLIIAVGITIYLLTIIAMIGLPIKRNVNPGQPGLQWVYSIIGFISKLYPYALAIPLYEALVNYFFSSESLSVGIIACAIVAPIVLVFQYLMQESYSTAHNYLAKPSNIFSVLTTFYYLALISTAKFWKTNYSGFWISAPVLAWNLARFWISLTRDAYYSRKIQTYRMFLLSLQLSFAVCLLLDSFFQRFEVTREISIIFFLSLPFMTKILCIISDKYQNWLLQTGIDSQNPRVSEAFLRAILDLTNLLEYREHYTEINFLAREKFVLDSLLHPGVTKYIFQTLLENNSELLRATETIYDPINHKVIAINWHVDKAKLLSRVPVNPYILKDAFRKIYLLCVEQNPEDWELHLQFVSYIIEYLGHTPLASLELGIIRNGLAKRNWFRKFIDFRLIFARKRLEHILLVTNLRENRKKEEGRPDLKLDMASAAEQFKLVPVFLNRMKEYMALANQFYSSLQHQGKVTEEALQTGEQLLQMKDQIGDFYHKFLQTNLFSTIYYFNFINLIANEVIEAESVKKIYENLKNKTRFKLTEIPEIDLFTSKNSSIVELSGEINSLGKILNIFHAGSRFFNYQTDELIGKNISKLMPKLIGAGHNSFIKAYIYNGKPVIINKKTRSYVCDKQGYVHPIGLFVKSNVDAASSEIRFKGFLQRIESDHEYILMDRFGFVDSTSKLVSGLLGLSPTFLSENPVHMSLICPELNRFFDSSRSKRVYVENIGPRLSRKEISTAKDRRFMNLDIILRKDPRGYSLRNSTAPSFLISRQQSENKSPVEECDETKGVLLPTKDEVEEFGHETQGTEGRYLKKKISYKKLDTENNKTFRCQASLVIIPCSNQNMTLYALKLFHLSGAIRAVRKQLSRKTTPVRKRSDIEPKLFSPNKSAFDHVKSTAPQNDYSTFATQPSRHVSTANLKNYQQPKDPNTESPDFEFNRIKSHPEGKEENGENNTQTIHYDKPEHDSLKEITGSSKDILNVTASFQNIGGPASSTDKVSPKNLTKTFERQISFTPKTVDTTKIRHGDDNQGHQYYKISINDYSAVEKSRIEFESPEIRSMDSNKFTLPMISSIHPKFISSIENCKHNITATSKLPSVWELALKMETPDITSRGNRSPFGESMLPSKRGDSPRREKDTTHLELPTEQFFSMLGSSSKRDSSSPMEFSLTRNLNRGSKKHNTTMLLKNVKQDGLNASLIPSEHRFSSYRYSRDEDLMNQTSKLSLLPGGRQKRIFGRAQEIRNSLLLLEKSSSNASFWNFSGNLSGMNDDEEKNNSKQDSNASNKKHSEFSSESEEEEEEEEEKRSTGNLEHNKTGKSQELNLSKFSKADNKRHWEETSGNLSRPQKLKRQESKESKESTSLQVNLSVTSSISSREPQPQKNTKNFTETKNFTKQFSDTRQFNETDFRANIKTRKTKLWKQNTSSDSENAKERARTRIRKYIQCSLQERFYSLKNPIGLKIAIASLFLLLIGILAFAVFRIIFEKNYLDYYNDRAQHMALVGNLSDSVSRVRNSLLDYLAYNVSGSVPSSTIFDSVRSSVVYYQSARLQIVAGGEIDSSSPFTSVNLDIDGMNYSIFDVAAINILADSSFQTSEYFNTTDVAGSVYINQLKNYIDAIDEEAINNKDSFLFERKISLIVCCGILLLLTLLYLFALRSTFQALTARFSWLNSFSWDDSEEMKEIIAKFQSTHSVFSNISETEDHSSKKVKSFSTIKRPLKIKSTSTCLFTILTVIAAIFLFAIDYSIITDLFSVLSNKLSLNAHFVSLEPTDLQSVILDYKRYQLSLTSNVNTDLLKKDIQNNQLQFVQNHQLMFNLVNSKVVGGHQSTLLTQMNESVCDTSCDTWKDARISITSELLQSIEQASMIPVADLASVFVNLTDSKQLVNGIPFKMFPTVLQDIEDAAFYIFQIVLGGFLFESLLLSLILLWIWSKYLQPLRKKFKSSARMLFLFPLASILSKTKILEKLDFCVPLTTPHSPYK